MCHLSAEAIAADSVHCGFPQERFPLCARAKCVPEFVVRCLFAVFLQLLKTSLPIQSISYSAHLSEISGVSSHCYSLYVCSISLIPYVFAIF